MIEHPVPKEHLRYIGDMTVSFALLEAAIQSLAHFLIADGQRIGQIITAELSFKNLKALVISLYRERYGEDADYSTLKDLMNRVSNLEYKRNEITHSIWGVGRVPNSILRIKTTSKEKNGLQFKFEDYQVNQLAEIVSDIKKLADEIQLFWIHLLDNGEEKSNS